MDNIIVDHDLSIMEITELNWDVLGRDDLSAVALAYYFFSIQFRENLEIALAIRPNDELLQHLAREECNTDNLSPWPGVTDVGEKVDHDEFMRRVVTLSPIDEARQKAITIAGEKYLAHTRSLDADVRAMSIASYECGGLERVFLAFLRASDWDTPLLQGFRHFLVKHIEFDSDADEGHGALARHLVLDGRVRILWQAFRDLLIIAVPRLRD